MREGTLGVLTDPRVYKRRIDHAGYTRTIIHRNPPVVDSDGSEIEPEGLDDEVLANAHDSDENPWAGVKIEGQFWLRRLKVPYAHPFCLADLLVPLTSASDLPNHPTLSLPYTSKSLSEMIENAQQMVQRERASLWRMKQLFTRFRGDETWIPCGAFETEDDYTLLGDESQIQDIGLNNVSSIAQSSTSVADTSGSLMNDVNGRGEGEHVGLTSEVEAPHTVYGQDTSVAKVDVLEKAPQDNANAATSVDMDHNLESGSMKKPPSGMRDNEGIKQEPDIQTENGGNASHIDPDEAEYQRPQEVLSGHSDPKPNPQLTNALRESIEEAVPPITRMTTRAHAAASSRASSPAESEVPSIHPLFIPPPTTLPDPSFGLPPSEADETRKYLLLYVQKQEEIVRSTTQLLNGLLKAERLRKTVMRWCKAERHVGEMSDGEDWYDKDEWGLEQDLIKGKEEDVEDDGLVGRKGRRRGGGEIGWCWQ